MQQEIGGCRYFVTVGRTGASAAIAKPYQYAGTMSARSLTRLVPPGKTEKLEFCSNEAIRAAICNERGWRYILASAHFFVQTAFRVGQ
jgi:hypothetical protein